MNQENEKGEELESPAIKLGMTPIDLAGESLRVWFMHTIRCSPFQKKRDKYIGVMGRLVGEDSYPFEKVGSVLENNWSHKFEFWIS
jgi:hypothetical protein